MLTAETRRAWVERLEEAAFACLERHMKSGDKEAAKLFIRLRSKLLRPPKPKPKPKRRKRPRSFEPQMHTDKHRYGREEKKVKKATMNSQTPNPNPNLHPCSSESICGRPVPPALASALTLGSGGDTIPRMASVVKILPPKVRDQIAAGEVIERPASVLKELIENSLDAGARRISVELEGGGVSLLRVVDDGSGMDRDDLLLAVERFATSKLSSVDDLSGIRTLGFRGEALPSIGSVSRLAITTRRREASGGWRLVVDGGEKSEPGPSGSSAGTSVEVRDLFFNVPARRKFLKSERSELDKCLAVVTSLALARFDVAFSVEHGGRMLLELPPAARLAERVAGLYGPALVESLAEAEVAFASGARCHGLVALPTEHRQNGFDTHVFVGGRPVRDRAVTAAVNAAYSGLLPLRRYPVTFLFLEFPAGQVDVNVHPAKAEVRFEKPGEVFGLIERAVRGALARAELSAAGGDAYGRSVFDAEPAAPAAPALAGAEPASGEKSPDARPAGRVSAPPPPPMARPARSERPRFTPPLARPEQPRLDLWSRVPTPESPAAAPATAAPTPAPAATEPGIGRLIGQALDGFLLVERADGVLIIDQHAMHERMLYEELRAARGGSAPSQGLVIPQTVEVSARHAEALRQSREELAAMGFDIEEFGGRSFLVRAAPAALRLSDLAGYLVELAEEIACADAKEAMRSDEARRERLLAMVACKAAVKAGDHLSREAAEDLVRRGLSRLTAGMPRTCPHGRPIFFLLDRAELAKRVGRK